MNNRPFVPLKPNTFRLLAFLLAAINIAIFLLIISPSGHYDVARVVKPAPAKVIDENELAVTAADQEGESEVVSGRQAAYYETVWKLVDRRIIDNYEVETYRQYEVHKDSAGRHIRTVPTDNYNYLRYWMGDETRPVE